MMDGLEIVGACGNADCRECLPLFAVDTLTGVQRELSPFGPVQAGLVVPVDPMDRECDGCLADAGEPCGPDCMSRVSS